MRRSTVAWLLVVSWGGSAFAATLATPPNITVEPRPGGDKVVVSQGLKQVVFLAGLQRWLKVVPEFGKNSSSVSFAVRLPDKVTAVQVNATVQAVTPGLQVEERLLGKLHAEVVPSADAKRTDLRLDVALDESLSAGTYGLKVQLTYPGTDAQGKQTTVLQDVDLSLVLPAATLLLPPRLVLEVVDGEAPEHAEFRLMNTSVLSRLSIDSVAHGSLPLNGGKAAAGQLGLDFRARDAAKFASTLTLGVGQPAYARALIEQPFPLGSTSGSLRISAKELASAVELPYEVRVRRGYGWLFFVAFLGVVAGNGLRWAFTHIEELGKARETLDEQLERLRKARAQHQDATFHGEVDKALGLIAAAFISGRTKALVHVFDASEKIFQAALGQLQSTKEQLVARNKVLAEVAGALYGLPAGLKRGVSALSLSLPSIARLLDADNVTEAGTLLAGLESELNRHLEIEGRAWSTRVADLLVAQTTVDAVLKEASPGLARTEVKTAVESFASTSASVALKERLTLLDGAWQKVAKFTRLMTSHMVAELAAARAALAGVDSPCEPGARAVAQVSSELAWMQKTHGGTEPEQVLEYMQSEVPERFLNALLGCMRGTTSDAQKEVSTLVDKATYVEAAKLAIAKTSKSLTASAEGVIKGAHDSLPFGAPILASARSPDSQEPSMTRGFAAWSLRTDVLGGAPLPLRMDVTRYWELARLGVLLFMGLLLSAVTTALFADNWIGTWEDVMKVFVWASALDLTATSITNTLSKLKKEPVQSTNRG
ncbi:hypothetical protein [Myxococcus sp. CA040A]|uniref:hypothetical protein n=1 Tax=Myxococcus sp. CA040A TaxID=2741738 RepID=UPI00157B0F92|nr:hypothetical protein [Myxococcus sp. CA040A]NTX04119.1 hypothetical protein [Myxococcus sp. CA040A]